MDLPRAVFCHQLFDLANINDVNTHITGRNAGGLTSGFQRLGSGGHQTAGPAEKAKRKGPGGQLEKCYIHGNGIKSIQKATQNTVISARILPLKSKNIFL